MRKWIAWIALCAACGSDGPDVDQPLVTDGGRLVLGECGYDLVTRAGASAPEFGRPELGDDPSVRHVHLGIAGDAHTSMVVQWRTADETTLASTVQYAEGSDLGASDLDRTEEGATFVYISGVAQNGETVRVHEAHLCGLSPDTEYSYRVGGSDGQGDEAWSDVYTFRTAPEPDDDTATVVFGSLGDSRDGYDVWQDMIELTATYEPDLILFTGDAVTLGALQDEWEMFFDVAEPVLARIPIVAAHGNHEVNAINFFSQFAMAGDEEDFAFRYGPAEIVVLNDTPADPGAITGKSLTVLDEAMAASDAPWKLLMHHSTLFSASTRHGADTILRDAWQPMIDEREVDLVLAGHDHDYERTFPMRGLTPQATPADGTIYVVSGGAGADLYQNGSDVWTAYSEQTFNTVIVTITGALTLDLAAYRPDGSLIDQMPTIVR